MIRVVKKMIQSTISGLTLYRQPSYLAAGLAAGLLVGLLPKDSLLPWAFATVFMFTRVNLLVMVATATICTFAAPYGDWLTHQVGRWVLESSQLANMFQRIGQLPVVPWLRLNNSVTLGTLVLCVPVCFLGYRSSRQAFIGYFRALESRRLSKLKIATDDYRKEITKQKTRRDGVAFETPATIAASVEPKTTTTPDGNVEKRFDTAASIDESAPSITPDVKSPVEQNDSEAFDSEIPHSQITDRQPGATISGRQSVHVGTEENINDQLEQVGLQDGTNELGMISASIDDAEIDDDESIELLNGNVVVDPLTGHISRIDAAAGGDTHNGPAVHSALVHGPPSHNASGWPKTDKDDTEDILAAIADDVMSIAADASRARQIISEDSSLANLASVDQIDRDILAIHQALDSADQESSAAPTVVGRKNSSFEQTTDSGAIPTHQKDSKQSNASLNHIDVVRMPKQFADDSIHSNDNNREPSDSENLDSETARNSSPSQRSNVSDRSDEPSNVIPPHESLQFLLRHLHRGEK